MPLVYRDFKAWVYCENDGDILEEYNAAPDPQDETVYTCWIASKAGKRFTVHWESLMKAVCDNRGITFVDGVETHSYVNIAASGKDGSSSGVKLATGEIRPYAFSDVILTDDDAYLDIEQSANADELGNITLKLYLVHARMEPIPRSKQRWRGPRRTQEINLYDGAIHERTKKICDHRVTLGDAVPFGPPRGSRPNSKKLVWEPVDRDDPSPHVTFRFKYRPRAYLQAQGIILSDTAVTPQKPIIVISATDDLEDGAKKQKKRKRPLAEQGASQRNVKREREESSLPLFLPTPVPSLLRDASQPIRDNGAGGGDVRAVFFEKPRLMEDSDEVVFLGYSQGGQARRTGTENAADTKTYRSTDVKTEGNGILLWVDNRGVIDLTLDD